MHRRLWVLAVAILMGLASGGAIAAQDASPAADAFITPDPADCTVAPRTVDELRAYLAKPAATPAAATEAPAGEPADDATVAAASAVVSEYYACINANAFLRSYALYTDSFLQSSIAGQDLNPDALSLFATPIAPQAEGERVSIAIGDVSVLDDGRVSVAVVSRTPLGGNTESTTTFILAEQDGGWLIDGMS